MRIIHHKTIYLLRYLALYFLCINTLQANDERWYEVELVIFKHTRGESFKAEQWPDSWPIPNTDDSVNLKRPKRQHAKNFKLSQNNETSFDEVLASLDASSRYKVLTYESWRQRGLNKNKAIGVHVKAGQLYSTTPTNMENLQTQTGSLFETHTDEYGTTTTRKVTKYKKTNAANRSDQTVFELDGTIKIVLSRFLHIYTDLLLLKPVHLYFNEPTQAKNSDLNNEESPIDRGINEPTGDKNAEGALMTTLTDNSYRIALAKSSGNFSTLQGFHFKEHRRMRSGELHYLDHPLMGLIVRISPIK